MTILKVKLPLFWLLPALFEPRGRAVCLWGRWCGHFSNMWSIWDVWSSGNMWSIGIIKFDWEVFGLNHLNILYSQYVCLTGSLFHNIFSRGLESFDRGKISWKWKQKGWKGRGLLCGRAGFLKSTIYIVRPKRYNHIG